MKTRNQPPSHESETNSSDVQTSRSSSAPQERHTGAFSISQPHENRRNSHSSIHENRNDSSPHRQPQLNRNNSNSTTQTEENDSQGDRSDSFFSPPLPEIQSDPRPISESQENYNNLLSSSESQDNGIGDTPYISSGGHSTDVRRIEVEVLAPNNRNVSEFDVSYTGAKYVEYESLSERLQTFSDWSDDYYVKPLDLAKAGLFFYGPGDRVRCYFCGGFLRDWEPNDNPLKEHQRWFKNCGFLRLLREGARANQ